MCHFFLKILVDVFGFLAAEKVGFVASPPPYLSLVSKSNKSNAFPITGVSFASGGAGIFNGTDELFVSQKITTLYITFFHYVVI